MENAFKLRPLEDVAIIERKAILPSQIKKSDSYLGLEDIEGGTGRIVAYRSAAEAELKSAKFKFTKHHILYGKLRPYLNKVVMPDRDGVCSTDILPILPKKDIMNRDYLAYFMRSARFVKLASARSAGANLPRLSPSELSKFMVACPSLEIQTMLANLLKKNESALEKRREAIRLLDDFLKSTFLEMFGNPGENPKDLPLLTLGQIVASERHAIKRGPFGGSLKKEIFVSSGYKVYEQKHAIQNDFKIGSYYVSETKFVEMTPFRIKLDDLIISCSGTIGKIAIVPKDAEKGIINQALLKLTLNKNKVLPVYFKFLLEMPAMQRKLFGFSHGSSIKNVASVATLKTIKYPIASLNDQTRFIAVLNRAHNLCEKMESPETELQNLFNALTQKAFKGEL